MLHLSRPALFAAARCHYDVLGVSRTASADEIKSAFKKLVKRTHPDTQAEGTSPTQTQRFRELVEAYRVLRNDKVRRRYDLERANRGNHAQGGHSSRSTMNPETAAAPSNPDPGYAIPGVLLGVVVLFFTVAASTRAPYKDVEHPRKLPTRLREKKIAGDLPGSGKAEHSFQGDDIIDLAPSLALRARELAAAPSSQAVQAADELVRAFYDPFFERWYKIPEGYEAPSGMDLTSFHHKRTDPGEWQRLLAEGELSRRIPRGGLQVRYLPAWDTLEPVFVRDPVTGKTVVPNKPLSPRGPKEQCQVQF